MWRAEVRVMPREIVLDLRTYAPPPITNQSALEIYKFAIQPPETVDVLRITRMWVEIAQQMCARVLTKVRIIAARVPAVHN